jgi:hypothetical protein
MKLCFAWAAQAAAAASGLCAHLAWSEPPLLVCMSDCCNRALRRRSSELRQMLDRIRGRLDAAERRHTF